LHILGKDWRDGYLDTHRAAGEVRIRVSTWWPLARLTDIYLHQPRSLRRVWNYFREIGLRELVLKIRSRRAENLRDRVFIAAGIGQIIESDSDSDSTAAAAVLFVAPCHSECVERVCLPRELTRPVPPALASFATTDGSIRLIHATPAGAPDWDAVAGWRRESEIAPPTAQALLDWTASAFSSVAAADAQILLPGSDATVRERSDAPCEHPAGTMSAVVFGLGHYAKTCILPNLDPNIRVACIHEIDPTQIGPVPDDGRTYDTAPFARPDERYDIYFVAGYHHTHADQTIHALGQGAIAVVEKPLVTTRDQLARLLPVVERHSGRLHGCFPLRFLPFWPLARRDLGVATGDPIHFHCLVFEVPLVRHHWYNWPVSRSRIVSNGCHWLDSFLFMNDYAAPTRTLLFRARCGDLNASVELENGAVFNMVLTDHGSPRIGLQDHMELRAGKVTLRIDNFSRYEAENAHRILRRTRIRMGGEARRMFREISRRIIAGEPGDSLKSIRQTTELMLTLDELAVSSDVRAQR
jgi:predicted dehydrogenase